MSVENEAAGPSGGSGERQLQVLDQATVAQYAWRDVWVVGARGAYDIESITLLADVLAAACREHAMVILDASGITFADSALLNLLILSNRTGDLRVAAPTQQLRRLLEITGADTVLKVKATLEEAAAC